jgi:hypothetical protein
MVDALNMDHLEKLGEDWFEGSEEEVPPPSVEAEEPEGETNGDEAEESTGEE